MISTVATAVGLQNHLLLNTIAKLTKKGFPSYLTKVCVVGGEKRGKAFNGSESTPDR
jgi:hypothetical protein